MDITAFHAIRPDNGKDIQREVRPHADLEFCHNTTFEMSNLADMDTSDAFSQTKGGAHRFATSITPQPGPVSFFQALCASGPTACADKLMLYGQFVGNWEADANWYLPDGTVRQHRWEIHFDWVLEGRAIQDVWITPPRRGPGSSEQSEPWGEFGNQYGTTIRVYDPKIDAWHVTYIDPYSGYQAKLTGRLRGDQIVQEGNGSDGALLRWVFSDISADKFRWHAEISRDGAAWHKALEMFARRCGISNEA